MTLLVGMLWACSVMVPAQTGIVSGTVRDEAGVPSIAANVLLKGTVLGSATDLQGRFTIQKIHPGSYALLVSSMGYQRVEIPITIVADSTIRLDVVLKETAIQTEEVVVTAGKRPQSFEEIAVSISVLESREIEERTILTLDDALRKIPGVNMTESQVNVRGSSGYARGVGTRVLLLMDGIPLLAGDAGEIKFDAIPMYLIDRIEVVKGAGSALYGSSALGGVINVLTKTPSQVVSRVRVHSGFYDNPVSREWKWWGDSPRWYNGLDAQRADARDDLSWLLSGGIRHNQGYRRMDDFVKWNALGKATWRIDPSRVLGAHAMYAFDNRGNWVFWKDLKNALVPPDSADVTERVHSSKFQLALHYTETFSSSFALNTRLYWYRTAFDTFSDRSDFSSRPLARTQSTADALGLHLQGTMAVSPGHILVGGMDGTFNSVASRTYGNREGFSLAMYLQSDYKIIESLNLSTGARFDVNKIASSPADAQINPRFGVAYVPMEGSILRASYGWGFRSPSIAERFATASAGALTTKPNPSLQSERSRSYEIGAQQILPIPGIVDVAFFLAEYENLVEATIDPSDGRIFFDNIRKAEIRGVETSIRASFFDGLLHVSAAYTYIRPLDVLLAEPAPLKYRPRHLAHASGEISFGALRLGGDFRYLSRVEAIDEALVLAVRDADKRVETFVTDVHASYDFKEDIPLKATFSIENVGRYQYVEVPGNVAPLRRFTLTLETQL